MDILRELLIELLTNLQLKESIVAIIADSILLIGLLFVSVIGYFIIKMIYKLTLKGVGVRSGNKYIKEFSESPVVSHLLKLIPALFLINMITYIPTFYTFFDTILVIIISYLVLKVTISVLDLINHFYIKYNEGASTKPIKGLLTFIKLVIFTIIAIILIANLIGESPIVILTGLGAMSAVLMLIFQDSILGLVAGFQMSANDLVRIGDWIEMPDHGVDGNVVDVTLTFVRVENWDKTIITIPAYKLIKESFVNWRHVFDVGGRRIKRSFNIDAKTVKIIDDELYEKLMKVEIIKNYLTERKNEINEYNVSKQVDTSIPLNGRRLTNLGVYRIYLTEYLKNNPFIHEEMWRIVRQLQPDNRGIPIEVYAFSNKTSWADYEVVMADIFDHIYATIEYFELKIYQEVSGEDLLQLKP